MRVVRDDPASPDPGFAELYAALPYEQDLEPWLGLARTAKPPVLYLGIGSGRLAVPLAKAGVELVGVDAHPGMLSVLRERLPGLSVIQARIENLRLDERFDLVIAPSHVLSTLSRLKPAIRHLGPGGRLAFELINPHWLDAGASPGVRVLKRSRTAAVMEVDYTTGHTHAARLALIWPEEVEGWLATAGLRLLRLAGGANQDLATSPTFHVLASIKADASQRRSGARGRARRQRARQPVSGTRTAGRAP